MGAVSGGGEVYSVTIPRRDLCGKVPLGHLPVFDLPSERSGGLIKLFHCREHKDLGLLYVTLNVNLDVAGAVVYPDCDGWRN